MPTNNQCITRIISGFVKPYIALIYQQGRKRPLDTPKEDREKERERKKSRRRDIEREGEIRERERER